MRWVGGAIRNRTGRVYSLILAGFLRELRMRETVCSLRDLARLSGMTMVRLGEIERGRGKRVKPNEAEAITRVLYAKPAVDTCRVCGCTDEWGCDVGCSWANAEHTLCSECVGKAGA